MIRSVFTFNIYGYMYMVGGDCVIVKSGRRICGTGAALANAPLVQDKSYFEIKIQCGGMFWSAMVHVHCVHVR